MAQKQNEANYAEQQRQKIKAATERLEAGIVDFFNSDSYKDYLKVMSKFHNYSYSNSVLIALQKPDATLLAGYSGWEKKFHRHVKRGEKGIQIFAPAPVKTNTYIEREKIDPETQLPMLDNNGDPVMETVAIKRPAFKIVTVFDVSQTYGEPLPELGVHDLTGDVQSYEDMMEAIRRTATVPISFEDIPGESHGYYHQIEKRIAIQEGMSQMQTVKTAVHELAHSRLHDIDTSIPANRQQRKADKATREVEAESIAYVVADHFGLDTSEYSFGYTATWSANKELPELKASLQTIRDASSALITEIEQNLADIQQDREKALAAAQEAEQTAAPSVESEQPTEPLTDPEHTTEPPAQPEQTAEHTTTQVPSEEPETAASVDDTIPSTTVPSVALKPVYMQTGSYAKEHGELDAYRESNRLNQECKTAIESAIRENFDGMHLNTDCIRPLIDAYGIERISYVLAATLQVKSWDGRFSPSNIAWANSISTVNSVDSSGNDRRTSFAVGSHSAVLNGFVSSFRKEASEYTRDAPHEVAEPVQEESPSLPDSPEHLAADIDAFSASYDPYEYTDTQDGDTTYETILSGIQSGNVDFLKEWLSNISQEDSDYSAEAKALLERLEALVPTPEAEVSFFVAECSEFHSLGEYHEGLSLEEALQAYQQIDPSRRNGIPCIGIHVSGNEQYEGEYTLMEAGQMLTELNNDIEGFRNNPFVQKADRALAAAMENLPPVRFPVDRTSEPQEAVYDFGNRYLHLQLSADNDWDYTIYDRRLNAVDGGRMGDETTHFAEALAQVQDAHHLTSPDPVPQVPVEKFGQMLEGHENSLHCPVCHMTAQEARAQNAMSVLQASHNATLACSDQFRKQYEVAYNARQVPTFLNQMVQRYGMERCKIVLASTIQLSPQDKRYHPYIRDNANKVSIPGASQDPYRDTRQQYRVNCHPVTVDVAFRDLLEMERSQQLSDQPRTPVKKPEQEQPQKRTSVLKRLDEKKKAIASGDGKSHPPGREKQEL